MIKIFLSLIIGIGISVLSMFFVPYHWFDIKRSLIKWGLLLLTCGIICFLFTKIYPLDSNFTSAKTLLSFPTSLLIFFMVFLLNASTEELKVYQNLIISISSLIFKGLGAFVLGYATFSFIILFFH